MDRRILIWSALPLLACMAGLAVALLAPAREELASTVSVPAQIPPAPSPTPLPPPTPPPVPSPLPTTPPTPTPTTPPTPTPR